MLKTLRPLRTPLLSFFRADKGKVARALCDEGLFFPRGSNTERQKPGIVQSMAVLSIGLSVFRLCPTPVSLPQKNCKAIPVHGCVKNHETPVHRVI